MNVFIGHTVTTFEPTGQKYRPFLWQLLKVRAVLFVPENEIETLNNLFLFVCVCVCVCVYIKYVYDW